MYFHLNLIFYLVFILIFRDFNPEIHDVYKVAELIYDVDYRTFAHVFKSKDEGVEAIKNTSFASLFILRKWRLIVSIITVTST